MGAIMSFSGNENVILVVVEKEQGQIECLFSYVFVRNHVNSVENRLNQWYNIFIRYINER